MILAVIGAAVKQKFTRKAAYGIDSSHTFKVVSHIPKASNAGGRQCHFSSVGRAHHS